MSTVTLSKQTRDILNNFCKINSSILIKEGAALKTIRVGQNAIAEYQSEETFPQTFGIYDLQQFLAGLSLFEDATLKFDNSSYVTINGNGRSVKYYFSDPEITLSSAPDTGVNFPNTDFSFNLKQEDWYALQKASAVYNLPDIAFRALDDGTINLDLCDKENDTGNVYSQTVAGETTGVFEVFMKVENLRLHPGNYSVNVCSKGITEWNHQSIDLKYYIALEP